MTVVVITNPTVNPGNAIVLANALPIHTVPPSMDTVNIAEANRTVQLIWETFVSVKVCKKKIVFLFAKFCN